MKSNLKSFIFSVSESEKAYVENIFLLAREEGKPIDPEEFLLKLAEDLPDDEMSKKFLADIKNLPKRKTSVQQFDYSKRQK